LTGIGGRSRQAVLLLFSLFPPALIAQQDTARTRDTAVVRLPTLDVTATATRSTRRPLEQPLAITELKPTDWGGARGVGLDEALAFVPGVVAQSRAGWTDVRLSIRGYGSRGAGDRSNSGTSRGMRVLVDGIPETEPDGRTAFDLIDLGASGGIEVIRSNASAVWGNAAGGVVSVSTLRGASEPWGLIEASGGSFGFRRFGLQAGYLPGGTGELGGTAVYAATDGWRDHSGGERFLVNLALSAAVGRRSRVGVFAAGGFNRYEIPGPLTEAQVEEDPTQANPVYEARRERRHNQLGRIGATYETHPAERHEVRVSGFVGPKALERSERGTYRDFTRYHVGGSALYRYRSTIGSRVSSVLSAGLDEAYQDGAILFYSLSDDGNRGDELRTDKREGAGNFGVFVQEELGLGEQWGVNVGARFDAITYYVEDYLQPDISGQKSFRHVSPKFGLNFRRTPTHSIYASIGGGVEAPAANETDPIGTFGEDTVYAINPLLEPITSTSFELGTKQVAVVGGDALWELSYDAAAYYSAVRNEIVPYRGGRFYFTAGRAGRAGMELGGRIRRGVLALQGSLAWAHHEYLDYVVDSVHYGKPGATADYSGNRVVGVPSLTHALGLSYHGSGSAGIRAQLTIQGNSGFFADDANTIEVDGFTIANLTLGLDRGVSLGGGLGIRGFVTINNLFDHQYIASAFLNPDVVNGEPVAFEPGLPRNVVVSFSIGWLGDR
jgi:iron complex outermembrane receptor protein